MKTLSYRILALSFVLGGLGAGIASAQPKSGSSSLVNRSVDRFTLLPGPTLLSPAPGAPQSGAFISIVPAGAVPTRESPPVYGPAGFRFTKEPRPASFRLGPGKLTLRPENTGGTVKQPSPSRAAPPAETLRFDSTLSPILPVSPKLE
jgi:hypothetical protein